MEIDAKVVQAVRDLESKVRQHECNEAIGYSWDEPALRKAVEDARLVLFTHIARVAQEGA